MNLRSAQATLVLGIAGLVLLTLGAWVALVGPAVGAIGDNNAARTEAQDRNAAMSLQLAQLRRQAEELPTLERLAGRLTQTFPPTADQPGFFAQVSAAAADAGIGPSDLTALSPGVPEIAAEPGAAPAAPAAAGTTPVVDPSAVAVQSVTLSVVGSYDELTRLLDRLESMPRAFLLSAADLTATESGLTLTLTGSTFVAPPLGAAPMP